jgi:hypothetical protein
MNRYSTEKDRTAQQSAVSPGMPHLLLYMCGCKGTRAGGVFRGNLPMVCPKCNPKESK